MESKSHTLDGNAIKKIYDELLTFFGSDFKIYIVKNPNTEIQPDILKDQIADLTILNSNPNPFVVPTPALTDLTFKSVLQPQLVLFIAYNGSLMAYVYHTLSPLGETLTSPYLGPSQSGDAIPCKSPTGGKPEEFLWTQEGPDIAYRIYSTTGTGEKLYWRFTGVEGIATLSDTSAHALSAKLNIKP